MQKSRARGFELSFLIVLSGLFFLMLLKPVSAQSTAFKQAVAEEAVKDNDIADFYRNRGFKSLWTSSDPIDAKRRRALVRNLSRAEIHGLPSERYNADGLKQAMAQASSPRDLGFLEVQLSRAFLRYAKDVQTGILVPADVDEAIVREIAYRPAMYYLTSLESAEVPSVFFRSLPPQSQEYNALMKQKLLLERTVANGGWGAVVQARKLEPGDTGRQVVALRDRLRRMGYLDRHVGKTFDKSIKAAVIAFQADHGLTEDGVVGQGTLEQINVSAETRLKSVLVSMERERWLNKELGARHIEVNLADFSAKIVDNGKTTFETRSVVGHRDRDRQSPEFSDVMEFMVVNPSWHVPRSIVTKEYLPELQEDPYAVQHIEITDARGRVVDRSAVDFTQFTPRTFPFAMRQPPSQGNALGLVKFMFPNKHNIYLHDTPHKKLFGREVRAYSHGCIRLADPFDFAYALLAAQSDDPEGDFQRVLDTGKETQVDLKSKVPVHIMYRTAFTNAKGQIQYRRDVYGRNAKVWKAMSNAGVVLGGVQG